MKMNNMRRNFHAIAVLTVLSWGGVASAAHPAKQQTFAAPDEGAAALVDAARRNDISAIAAILGPQGRGLVVSGDKVADDHGRQRFVESYDKAHHIVLDGDAKATLVIGPDDWPMPIPMVKAGERWRFDTRRGRDEILTRRIGRNELAAIQVCLAIVDAQREFATRENRSGSEKMAYAAHIVSTPGKHDGLYWESPPGDAQSPLGSLVAAAASEGYGKKGSHPLAPYHGYYYRILTRQGPAAKGGAYDYLEKGRLVGGFAVLAIPARYGASGVMTFIANQDGLIYERDLGRGTPTAAAHLEAFDPVPGWKPVEPKKP
jgi:hypothetical protein